jgi:hypothetical protein
MWTEWVDVDQAAERNGSFENYGIYQLRIVNREGRSSEIGRLIGTDRSGLVYIGRSGFRAIEFRIIYLQRKQSGLLPESHHQGGSAAHPLERAASMHAQLSKGARAEVG